MTSYSLKHLADSTLLNNLATLVGQDRITNAALLAHLAEVDERKLYRPAAYPSMFLYCVNELHMSEDAAYKRISVARTARQFPAIFPLLAEGRLNQTAVLLMAPHLTSSTADELLAAATHKTKPEIELLLAERFPRPDVPALLQAIAPAAAPDERAPQSVQAPALQLAPERVVPSIESNTPVPMVPLAQAPAERTRLAPLSPGRYALQVTVDKETYEQLRHAQALLGHAVPSGDVAQVLKRALDSLVRELEKQKFAKCARPRPQRGAANGRRIPAAVKRAVVGRDGGQCTFVSETGKRCESRTRLELDHVVPFARGGEATESGIRLRCRAHNQHAADCTFGPEFMDSKKEGRAGSAKAKAQANAEAKSGAPHAASSPA